MSATFVADDNIASIAEAYAQDAVGFARVNFKIVLDWSDSSIERLETILDVFYKQRSRASPPSEQAMQFAKMFGSYVGEVFRRNHSAAWGMVTLDGTQFPGMQGGLGNSIFWPWGRVQSRLLEGEENNVWHYYLALLDSPAT